MAVLLSRDAVLKILFIDIQNALHDQVSYLLEFNSFSDDLIQTVADS